MSQPTLAVTGSTGHLGGLIAARLADAGLAQRLIVRGAPGRATHHDGVEVVTASYSDRDAAVAALRVVETLFMVSASESADRLTQHRTFIDAAVEAGVGHVVYTSFLGAAPDATFTLARDHWSTEQHLRESGMAFTVLRDSLYLDFLPDLAGPDGVIRGPAGEGVVGAIARADVARVAVAVLTDPAGHSGRTYDLTGREALTLAEVARILTDLTGTPTIYHHETLEEAYASRASFGAPDWQVDAWVSTYTAIAAGELAAVNDNVETLTGTAPLTLEEYLSTA